MLILDKFPTAHEFYKNYWGQKPFLVRGYVNPSVFDTYIDGDELAGLSLEDDVKSRLVTTAQGGKKWTCEHGPLAEDRYETLGEENWSLLVQNIDQYHPDTADLLQYFSFSPRWLLDDIMVSYSTVGGTVGPHTDSYHVFLVQGTGRRLWTVDDHAILDPECIAGLDLKVLKDGVDGEPVEVQAGDVIYIPPHFGHAGVTLETAMTFSVGFLGPKMSELFVEYGYYLEQSDLENARYTGQGLNEKNSNFMVAEDAQSTMRAALINSLHTDGFTQWMVEYFSTPTHGEGSEPRKKPSSEAQLLKRLKNGEIICRPAQVKMAMTASSLGVYGTAMPKDTVCAPILAWLNGHDTISWGDIQSMGDQDASLRAILYLYNQSVLVFEGDEADI